jgi:hypothetical protein
MYTDKGNPKPAVSRDQEKAHDLLKARLRWKIQRAQRTLSERSGIELPGSKRVKAMTPVQRETVYPSKTIAQRRLYEATRFQNHCGQVSPGDF